MQVKVFVTPRKGILDPQGRTVEHALQLGSLASPMSKSGATSP